jgi:hypothetical protein
VSTTDDKPRRRKRTPAAAAPTEPARASTRSSSELAALDPRAFRRAMLEQVLADLDAARLKGTMNAVMTLTSQAIRLRAEIAAEDEREREATLAYRSTDELVADLVQAIAALPDGVFERIEAAVQQRRTGRPRMRIVGS